ncbi:hypothetical protein Nepgr_020191 [Nepenthes gracilis]|uniref:Fumarylacetoacetase n=1 Tax=Nepenthes gracilis TaxID=150966 RepID=A0AAD3SUY7_NEPGR|nr:hypothetical protein Nepgr_020191 [Nepenthes gracilis]
MTSATCSSQSRAQITISTEPNSLSAFLHLIPLRLLETNLISPPKNKISWCNSEVVANSFSIFWQSPYNWTRAQEAIGGHKHWYCLYCQCVTVGRKSQVCETILQVSGNDEAHLAVEVQCLYSLLDVTMECHLCCWTCRWVTNACMDEGIEDQCSSHGVKQFTEQLSDAKVIAHEGYPQAECCRLSVGHPDATINVSEAFAALSVAGNFGFQPFSHGVACTTRAPIQKLLSSTELTLRDNANLRGKSLIPMSKVEMLLPTNIGDYTDFFASLRHATNCGTIFRGKANPVPLNWSYLPIAYHGRASSVVISRTGIVRPSG